MAIGFARLEFVKRSSGKTACAKSAYNSRSKLSMESTGKGEAKIFDWSFKEKPLYNEILIPDYVDSKFKKAEILWNAVEQFENRMNSQVAMELVLALPDDKMVSNEDRIELSKTFVKEHFVLHGFAAQIDIHIPEKTEETAKEEHNWHAHVLISPRRFTQDGQSFEKNKPRDFFPVVRGGKVISGPDWGKLWTHHQNQYFESKGLDLRVDPNGIVSQIHLGPVRMRGRAFSLLEDQSIQINLNSIDSQNPRMILEKITETQNIFCANDVDRFLNKHVAPETIADVRESFWKQSDIVQLFNKETGQTQNQFTTIQILEEEKKILRIADRLVAKNGFRIKDENEIKASISKLTKEQADAFKNIVSGRRLCCIEGLAGTGKSHLLAALKNAYQNQGYTVRGFGPDNATANVLKECGITNSENIYRFLFSHFHDKIELQRNKEVWIVDEAGKLGSRPLLEFLKTAEKSGAQIIFSGDTAQIPSVERGSMFMAFCEKFGCQLLQDIQRQKSELQRDIAKKLATGDIAKAFDVITSTGGFKWAETKKEAIESLVKQWAIDRELFPNSSTLILAHSNAEVGALNEFVRVYRKERGELGEREYLCETPYGKIYVSEGDRIEFRKNDKELGVSNGAVGTVVSASKNKFSIKIQNEKNSREITFDPGQYPYFQLGYATTYYRSQGRTVDRAYVLHSPLMNREMFYVGLTRHVHTAFCFVSKSQASCLSDLKRQAFRRSKMQLTSDFVTQDEMQNQQERTMRKEELDNLTGSDSLFDRLKGKTLQAVDSLQSKASGVIERIQDRRSDKAFFQPNFEKTQSSKAMVLEVAPYKETELVKEGANANKPVDLIKEEFSPQQSQDYKRDHKKNALRDQAWTNLPEKGKGLLLDYYALSDSASCFNTIVKSESENLGKNDKAALHYTDWMQSCVRRNQAAHMVVQSIPNDELNTLLSKKSLEIVKYRASRHEAVNQPKQSTVSDLEIGLRDNIDSLLFRLFPDGPTRRDNKGLRFGGKGSISVSLHGAEAGSFYNFEKGEGGGLLKLIEETCFLDRNSAIGWAKNFLGESQSLPTQNRLRPITLESKNEDTWVTLKPNVNVPAPPLSIISSKLDQQYKETARHTFKDEAGNVLFYTLRLVEKANSAKKIILPLSYGYYNGDEKHPKWSLKGYQAEKKPLYNLDLLHGRQDATVLVVEGEKTADAANKLFGKDNIVVVTWSGGASASAKTDWSPLYMRDVIIWPDNDAPGFKACDTICSELRRLGVNSLKAINRHVLQKDFPEKWDLADPLPEKITPQIVQDMISNADEKSMGIANILNILPKGAQTHSLEVLKANEVLWRVEERLRPQLEVEFKGKSWEIRDQIITELAKILKNNEATNLSLSKDASLEKINQERLAFAAMMFQASKGFEPSKPQLDDLRQILSKLDTIQATNQIIPIEKEAQEFVIRKYLGECLETETTKPITQKIINLLRMEIDTISEKMKYEKTTQHEGLEKERQLDISV